MIHLKNAWVFFNKSILLIATALTLLTTCLYIQCNVYHFDKPQLFSGNKLYNPYNNDTCFTWKKANFHAHSIAWAHLTNGHQTPNEIWDVYSKLGFDVACISNYHHVVARKNGKIQAVPVYEHGYNLFKTHQLVFEPTRTSFFDLPFFQTTSMKQSVLTSLSNESSCLALNHPVIRNGYTDHELTLLTGYDLLEVLNHSANSVSKWDIALSSGKPVWCVGNDDLHNAENPNEVGVCWTMINLSGKNNIIEALKTGNAYSVQGNNGRAENSLKCLTVSGDTLHVQLSQPAGTIKFIGQNGVIRREVIDSSVARYVFTDHDTFIRIEVINTNSTLYLNPVIRYNGPYPPSNTGTASINLPATIIYKLSILFTSLFICMLLYRKKLQYILMALKSNQKLSAKIIWPALPAHWQFNK